jgi:hypothetical protein
MPEEAPVTATTWFARSSLIRAAYRAVFSA